MPNDNKFTVYFHIMHNFKEKQVVTKWKKQNHVKATAWLELAEGYLNLVTKHL